MTDFDRSHHVYQSSDFDEIIKDTIRFFNGTPIHPITLPQRFTGTGVYGIYCIAKYGLYRQFHLINRTGFYVPIYIGKAVPKGWRQARQTSGITSQGCELYNRLQQHSRNIEDVEDLDRTDYFCRFMILENRESDLIGTVEAALIRQYQPLWNTLIDGFGNHDPGKGRYQQAKSDWDVCHPGRAWADKCQGVAANRDELHQQIQSFLERLSLNDG
ncbi:Eco29kI family restriction endonuclease [Prochlorothrix hollandica]|uniref:Eco29kI family restriction endonuclease n=1 Tax=Prochlorothrix hollandica TaxID=1223 RepID=UPI00333E9C72